jgi:hypothetical protein
VMISELPSGGSGHNWPLPAFLLPLFITGV